MGCNVTSKQFTHVPKAAVKQFDNKIMYYTSTSYFVGAKVVLCKLVFSEYPSSERLVLYCPEPEGHRPEGKELYKSIAHEFHALCII